MEDNSTSTSKLATQLTVPGSSDPFDSADFNTVDFVNRLFPNEQKLAGVDQLIDNLQLRIRRVDNEILDAVRQQSSSGNKAKENLDNAKKAIQDLFTRIRDIQSKAEQSELMVQEICHDIKKLDYAKKNLTATITALRRLAMLVSAVDQLEAMSSKRMYREAGSMLEAVNQLSTHFDAFKNIPKISEMRGKIDTIKLMLRSSIFKDFEALSTIDTESSDDYSDLTATLADACLVVDVLDPYVRDELLGDICNKEVTAYNQVFTTVGEVGRLDRTERRYAWIKRQLKQKEEIWDLFPHSWRVPKMLCMYFCKITRAQLSMILDENSQSGDTGESGVRTLLEALHKTLEFEIELEERFGGEDDKAEEAEAMDDEEESEGDQGSASAVRTKYERLRREKQREAAGAGADGDTKKLAMDGAVAAAARTSFRGSVSSCFEPHLKAYVELEERQLMETLDKLMQEETWSVEGTTQGSKVLGSASALFLNIKKVLKRCSQLTRRETLFNLYKVFQRVLKAFGVKLLGGIPISGVSQKPCEKDEMTVCLIINTAEYCRETVGPLGETIAKTLDKPFSDSVDMTSEEDEFSGVITKALSVLVSSVESRLDSELANMVRAKWDVVEAVGDQSEYVSNCSAVLNNSIPAIGSTINNNYFRYFTDKLSGAFVPRVYQHILKCKRFSEAGAQQLLLDTIALKTMLLDIPILGGEENAPASYTKMVNREMGKAEALLKVILSPVEGLCDTFRALLPNSAPNDFKQVLELKGLRKADQQGLLEEWGKRSAGVVAGSRVPAIGKTSTMSSMGMPSMSMPSMPSMNMPSRPSMPSMSMTSMSSYMRSSSSSGMSTQSSEGGSFRSKLRFMSGNSSGSDGGSGTGSSMFSWSSKNAKP